MRIKMLFPIDETSVDISISSITIHKSHRTFLK